MPLYEYRCGSCAETFEVLQRLGAGTDDLVCPACGDPDVARQLSTFAAGGSGASQGASAAMAPAGGCCRGTPTGGV